MCSSKLKPMAELDARQVLQPPSNRVAPSEADRPIKKKTLQKSVSLPTSLTKLPADTFLLVDPDDSTLLVPLPKPAKRSSDPNGLTSSTDKLVAHKDSAKSAPVPPSQQHKKKNKKMMMMSSKSVFPVDFSPAASPCDIALPGSIAAAQRERSTRMQAQRKQRIAHYGRTPAKLQELAVAIESPVSAQEEKKCSFITPNSDPVYAAYHDEEWGVPVHDDRMLFELLVLTGAQVGMDWTTILKKRNEFRAAFAEFDAESVSKFTERQMASISVELGMDLGRVRGFVENSKRIIEVKRDFGSLDKYLWGFVNHKPISANYKSCRKIPAKTSKSECISKDMVRRGFRFVGPTVVHSFMQAAGLTNDHIVFCPRHRHCSRLAQPSSL